MAKVLNEKEIPNTCDGLIEYFNEIKQWREINTDPQQEGFLKCLQYKISGELYAIYDFDCYEE